MDGGTCLAIEQAAEVVRTDVVLGRIEAPDEIHLRPPFAVAGGEVGAGHRRVVAADPAAQRNLADHQQHRGEDKQPQPGRNGCGQRRQAPGQPQAQQEQQTQGGEAAQQMRGHHLRPELQRDRPHAERRLRNHHAEQQQRQFHRPSRLVAATQGLHRQPEDHQPQGAGKIAMDHLVPALVHLQRCLGEAFGGQRLLVLAHRYGEKTVATRPIRAAEAGMGQPRIGAQQHDHHGQQRGEYSEAISGA